MKEQNNEIHNEQPAPGNQTQQSPPAKTRRENVTRYLPYILFLTGLLVIYIYRSHRTEKKIREISKLNKEVKELYSEYITLQTEILNGSRSSNLEEKMLKYGIKPASEPPKTIRK